MSPAQRLRLGRADPVGALGLREFPRRGGAVGARAAVVPAYVRGQRRQVLLEQLAVGQAEEAGLGASGGQAQAVGEEVVVDLAVLGDVDAVAVALVGGGEPSCAAMVVAQQVRHLVDPHARELLHGVASTNAGET